MPSKVSTTVKRSKKKEPDEPILRVSKKAGRPRAEIDLEELEKLCGLHCTIADIAGFFDVSADTIERRAQDPAFRAIMDCGYAKGRVSLRRMQMEMVQNGSATMAIWLGKQLLGQKDRHDIAVQGEGTFTLQELLESYRRITIGRGDAGG